MYAILDVDAWRGQGVVVDAPGVLESIAGALLDGGAATLQVRAKRAPASATVAMLQRLLPLARAAGVPLVANDRLDLAQLAGVDALHVGQDDLPLADVRRLAPALAVGVSTHDRRQLGVALAARPTYVAFGPVFDTASKHAPDPTVGPERLAEAATLARSAQTPLVAIGGVTLERVPTLVAAGVRWAATIGALIAVDAGGAPDLSTIVQRTRALDAALRGAAG